MSATKLDAVRVEMEAVVAEVRASQTRLRRAARKLRATPAAREYKRLRDRGIKQVDVAQELLLAMALDDAAEQGCGWAIMELAQELRGFPEQGQAAA